MRIVVPLLVLCGTVLLAATLNNFQPQSTSPAPLTPRRASPFFCNHLALTPAERKRHFEELGPKLRSLRRSVRELDNGYEFEFPGDGATYQLLTEWAIQERRCCPFFEIALRLDPENGPLWLRLTGRPGTKEFIKVDAPSWTKIDPVSGTK